MEKRYHIELDRNERDFATFFKRQDVSLSKNQLRVLIASRSNTDQGSMFDTETFLKKLVGHKIRPHTLFNKKRNKSIKP